MHPAVPAACAPRAGLGKPVNINVLLEHTGAARGSEVSVALPTAELHPPRGLPKGLYFGFLHTDKELAAS